MPRLLRLWFGFDEPVERRAYFWSGVFLMAVKLGVDVALVYAVTGHFWSPLDYVSPLLSTRLNPVIAPAPPWLLVTMGVWALPFLWVGVSMTLRRAINAGLSPWIVLLFFAPVLNWILMLALAIVPPREARNTPADVIAETRLQAAFKGIAVGVLIGMISVALHVLLFHRYSAAVFLGTPFTMGAAAGWFYNRGTLLDAGRTAGVGALTIAIAGLASLVFALEGAVCIAMALPLALPIGAFGAVIGRAIRGEHLASRPALLCLIALPASVILDRPAPPPLREVASSIDIDAPPERVWPHVVSFAELSPPPEWFFRLGIAYPMRARIQGAGPGAVRTCEFSTGPFVEPITDWDPPRRLAFDVESQPPPMHEWSPYRDLHPPHLDGTMRSRRGEFRLVALADGRTRLEGSTWYELQLEPRSYWSIWSDVLVHQIHGRVLRHIKGEVEAQR